MAEAPGKHVGRALPPRGTGDPVWQQLEQLARDYKRLQPGPGPERDRLRSAFFDLFARTWVRMVSDDADAPSQMQHTPSALETVLRQEAMAIAGRNTNSPMVRAFGGFTNLSAEVAQGFVGDRAERYGKREKSLLSGIVDAWDADRGASLRTLIHRAAANFLKEVHRRWHSGHALAAGATPPTWDLAPEAPTEPGHDAADWLEAKAAATAADGADSVRDQLQHDQARRALDAAVAQLSPDLRALWWAELEKAEHGLSDADLLGAKGPLLGFSSRQTLTARRKQLHLALRALLGERPDLG